MPISSKKNMALLNLLVVLFSLSLFSIYNGLARASQHAQSNAIFPLSVASGDPHAHGFLLMTHLLAKAIDPCDPVLTLEISDSNDFDSIVFRKEIAVHPVLTEALELSEEPLSTLDELWKKQLHLPDHSTEIPVKVFIDEPQIEANRYYYYRFSYHGTSTHTGRARTLPEENAALASLRLAIVTCQDYTTGYYHAFDYLAQEDLDFVVHLGDAIYEYDRYPGMSSRHIIHPITLPHGVDSLAPEAGVKKANSLADYRSIYRLERSDPNFQRALERHTWIFTRDDHEFADNASWDYEADAPGLPEHDPRRNWPKADKYRLMLNALQAWSEYLPMRTEFNPLATNPQAALSQPFKTYRFGTLADLFLLAGRLFRSSPTSQQTSATMLGLEQKQWLLQEISNSQASWQLFGNQTLMAPFRISGKTKKLVNMFSAISSDGSLNPDAWDGFGDERQELLNTLSKKDKVVVFTGDMHTSLASYLKKDFKIKSNLIKSNIIGAEFMTPSITSPNFSSTIKAKAKIAGFTDMVRLISEKKNRHFEHFNGGFYGYSIANIQESRVDWFVYKIGKKSKKSKYLRKYLYYIPATRELGKLNKKDVKNRSQEEILQLDEF